MRLPMADLARKLDCSLVTDIEKLEGRLHTPGFVPKNLRIAPAEALILHFDWVLRSRIERIEKLSS
jgi:hypothetical protein